jgi:hypothetical protein
MQSSQFRVAMSLPQHVIVVGLFPMHVLEIFRNKHSKSTVKLGRGATAHRHGAVLKGANGLF